MSIRVLGIDPGYALVGYALLLGGPRPTIEERGVIQTTKGAPMALRLAEVSADLRQLAIHLRPHHVALEVFLGFRKNPTASNLVAQARGAILAQIGEFNLPLYEYHPSKAKTALTGKANAKKAEVIAAVRELYGDLRIKHDDEADAIAIAYTHVLMLQSGAA